MIRQQGEEQASGRARRTRVTRCLAVAELNREPALAFEPSTTVEASTQGEALIPIEATNLGREHAIAKAAFGATRGAVYQPRHRYRRSALVCADALRFGRVRPTIACNARACAGRRPNAFGNKRQNP